MPRPVILILSVFAMAAPAAAQTGQIVGTVSDSTTGQPIASAEVTVVGTVHRARTRDDGTYAIIGVAVGTRTVEVRHLGYQPRRQTGVVVSSDGIATVNVRLSPGVFQLQEVVVTGVVGETPGELLPFTVGRLDADKAPVPPPNALETIQGKIAGVTVLPTSGQPGSGATIQLRTPTSINKSNSPLIAVDGVILGTTSGTSADLNSLDIERVEVLKGAAAASLYGSRAQAGVIQIWTRRGDRLDEGRTQVTLRTEVGFNSLVHKVRWAQYHFYRMDSTQAQYVNTAGRDTDRVGRVTEPTTSGGFRFQDNPYPSGTQVFDQVDAFFDPGTFYTNSMTLAQRSGVTNWFVSVGNHRSEGVLQGNGAYRRYDARLNLDHRPRRDLSLSLSGFYSRSVRDELEGNTFFDLINIAPDVNLREPDPDGTPFAFQPDNDPRSAIRANPLYKNATEQEWTARGRFLGNATVRYTPRAWVSFEGNLSYDRSDRFTSFFLDRGLKSDQYQTGGPGFISQQNEFADAINASASVTLNQQIGATSVRTMLRSLMEREDNNEVTASGEQLAIAGLPDLTNAQERTVNSGAIAIRANSYFAITSVEHAGKYIFDGLVRRDGSSLFGPAERWHTYNRVSTAYRMAEEPWWPFEQIGEFKLRFSRGTAGGRPTFPDQYETLNVDAAGTLTKETLGNEFLKPERSTETEYGLDLIALGRVSVQLSYARSTVRDQLILIPQLAKVGYPFQWQNAGTLQGNTFEATIDAQLLNRPNLTWRAGLIFDRSRHRITEFDRACFRTGPSYRCAGEPLGVMYGNHFLRHPGELTFVPESLRNQFAINDDGLLVPVGLDTVGPDRPFRYTEGVTRGRWGRSVVINGVSYAWGVPIRQLDAYGNPALVRIGNSNPDFHFGVANEVKWGNVVLYGLVDVQVGGQVFNATKMRQYQWYRSGDEDQWSKPDSLKKPPAYYDALYNGNDESDWFVEPGGFVKFRELSVRYRVPLDRLPALRSFGIRGAWVALVGRNMFTITNFSGYDPEVRDEEDNPILRADDFDYPRFRTITATVSIEF
ncbi:MAG TPA: SusC/RagA family TonB-linked outer membrane protein [Gemmatimonadales bacterium]|nr:SusC/RagA family TonB-linked outer membrane protein [Gemmatimonadales bacterium]